MLGRNRERERRGKLDHLLAPINTEGEQFIMGEHTLRYLLPTISKGYLRWVTLIADCNAKKKKINNHTLNSLKQRGKNK